MLFPQRSGSTSSATFSALRLPSLSKSVGRGTTPFTCTGTAWTPSSSTVRWCCCSFLIVLHAIASASSPRDRASVVPSEGAEERRAKHVSPDDGDSGRPSRGLLCAVEFPVAAPAQPQRVAGSSELHDPLCRLSLLPSLDRPVRLPCRDRRRRGRNRGVEPTREFLF